MLFILLLIYIEFILEICVCHGGKNVDVGLLQGGPGRRPGPFLSALELPLKTLMSNISGVT
jgi:hypothetical protein